MAERNLLLIGEAEEIDLLLPEVRAMLDREGVYLAADTARPGYTVPLVVMKGRVYSMQVDTELDPTRFHPTVCIAGPFYAPGEEQSAEPPPAASPEGYYLASFKHKSPTGAVLWWMPNDSGYTPDLEQAGVYTELKPGYHDSEHTVPVPVSFIDGLRVRRYVDAGDTPNHVFWSAKELREALGSPNAGLPEPVLEVDIP